MKKTLVIALAGIVAALTACGQSTSTAQTMAETAATTAATAAEGEKITYSYCVHTATGWMDEAMDMFNERLQELSGGRIVGKGYSAGTMGTEQELIDAVMLGDMTMSTPVDQFTLPAMGLDDWTSLPGIATSSEEVQERFTKPDAPLGELLDEQFQAHGLVRLGGLDNGFRMFATNKDVDSLAAIKGMKVRVSSIEAYVDLYTNAGMQPTIIDSSEAMSALQQGTIDAVDNSLVNLANQGYIDMCNKVLAVNVFAASRSIICNKDWYDALSAEDQALVDQAAQEAAEWCNAQFYEQIDGLYEDERWTIYELNDEQKAVFADAAAKVRAKMCESMDQDVVARILEVIE